MYNFICLLNIPNVIRNYGPIRNIWEGATQGEGFIRVIKPELSAGLRKNWQVSKMKKLLQQNALNMLMRNVGLKHRSTEERKKLESNYYIYPSIYAAHDKKNKRKPLSGVVFDDVKFGIVLVGNCLLEMFRVESSTEQKLFSMSAKNLCDYYSWSLSYETIDATDCTISSYILFLPMIDQPITVSGHPTHLYTLVYSTWNESMSH